MVPASVVVSSSGSGSGPAAVAVTPAGTHGRPPPHVRGPEALQAPLLMCGALGWQAVWSMEMAYASPLLLSLGLSKSATAAVLLAGPLAGLVVQPSIGYLSDSCTHPWGRRRPWLAAACVIATVGMLGLGFARPLVALCGSVAPVGPAPRSAQILASVGVFAVDFGVNAVMALDRALCVDMLPASHQASGANWAARLAGLGDVLGLQASHMDLPQVGMFHALISALGLQDGSTIVPGLSNLERQMACLCLLSSSMLLITHTIAAYVAVEVRLPKPVHATVREPLPDLPPLAMALHLVQRAWRALCHTALQSAAGVADLVMDLVRVVRLLPRPYLLIFATQFASWIGWFPLLFYSTLWVANIWRLAHAPSSSAPAGSGLQSRSTMHLFALAVRSAGLKDGMGGEQDAEAARYGAKALFYRAVISLTVSICTPIVVRATVRPVGGLAAEEGHSAEPFQEVSQSHVPTPAEDTRSCQSRWCSRWFRLKDRLHLIEPVDLWLLSIVFLAAVLAATAWPEFHVAPQGASALMAAIGMPWAVVGWIPFTLIGTLVGNDRAVEAYEEQSGLADSQNTQGHEQSSTFSSAGKSPAANGNEGEDTLSDTAPEWVRTPFTGSTSRGVYHPLPRPSDDGAAPGDPETTSVANSLNDGHLHHKAGTILGLLNIAIVVPQFLSSALSSLLFWITDRGAPKESQTPMDQTAHDAYAIGLTLRIGALCMIAAAWSAYRLATRCRVELRPVE